MSGLSLIPMLQMNMSYPDFKVNVSCMTYNHSSYILDALNGFVMQKTDFPFVCTIVDDASTDGEQKIIHDYFKQNFFVEEPEVAYHRETEYAIIDFARHKTNQNCFFAILYLKENHYQKKKSKTPYLQEWRSIVHYVALCEGDDYWIDSLKLQKQVDFLDRHSDYSFCAHDTKVLVQKTGELKYDKYQELIRFPEGYTITFGSKNWVTRPLSLLFRREIFDDARYKECRSRIDRVLVYFALRHGNGILLPDVMAVYRVHEGGICSGTSYSGFYPKAFDSFKAIVDVDPCDESLLYAKHFIEQELWKLLLYRDKQNLKTTESFIWNHYSPCYCIYLHCYSLFNIINNYWDAALNKLISVFGKHK